MGPIFCMNIPSYKPKTKTTDGIAILIIIALLAAGATFKAYYWVFPPAPAVEEAPYVPSPAPPITVEPTIPEEPPSEMRVVEPPPLPPGDDGTEEKLRDVSWVSFGSGSGVYSNVHSAYTNRFYAYSLGYDMGSTISLPPRSEKTTLTNTAGGKKSAMMLLVSEDLSDPDQLHVRQLFYDGYAVAVGARMHMQASNTCNSDGCYLELVEN